MEFSLPRALEILERTPDVVATLLRDAADDWLHGTEGPDTWSPFHVVAHLIDAERDNWIVRTRVILEQGDAVPFPPFDRFAHLRWARGKQLGELLEEFRQLRATNVTTLRGLALTPQQLARRGRHPEFGAVTLSQLLATWVAHDLGHVGQMVRVMARQYRDAVGPWAAYLPIMSR